MSHRLQVLLDPKEFSIVKKEAIAERRSVSEWVRNTIREKISRSRLSKKTDPAQVLTGLNLPAPPIDQMLMEIEEGRS